MPSGSGTVATQASVDAVSSTANSANTKATSALDKVNASYTVLVDANGYVTGYKLQSDGSTSSFVLRTDTFSIVAPGDGARTEFSSGNWRVYDSNGVLRIRFGVW
jgi:hypothetical protein